MTQISNTDINIINSNPINQLKSTQKPFLINH